MVRRSFVNSLRCLEKRGVSLYDNVIARQFSGQTKQVRSIDEKKQRLPSDVVQSPPSADSVTMRTPKRKIIRPPRVLKSEDGTPIPSLNKQKTDTLIKGSSKTQADRTTSPPPARTMKPFKSRVEIDLPPPIQIIRKFEEEPSEETDRPTLLRNRKSSRSSSNASTKSTNTNAQPSSSNRPKGKLTFSKFKNENEDEEKDRPFTLPPGAFKPKQSLGQNFLSDQNYVMKICDAFKDDSVKGNNVVEIGPGPGALTRVLYPRYPNMTAIEVDQRAVEFIQMKLPGLNVQHLDVLQADWPSMAADKGGALNIVANLPYYIVSQVLFSLADSHRAIDTAVLTMQLEVALRIVAKPSTKEYGIPSVVFQLYGSPTINFLIPPTVFYPKPKVDSALLTLDFRKPNPALYRVDGDHLRRVLTASFQKRRKMLRHSLKDLLDREGFTLDDRWATKRPEELTPDEFVQLTVELFGENPQPERTLSCKPIPVLTPPMKKIAAVPLKKRRSSVAEKNAADAAAVEVKRLQSEEKLKLNAEIKAAEEALELYEIQKKERCTYVTRPIWRMALFGASGTRGFGMNPEEEIIEKERLENKRLKKEKRKQDLEEEERFLLGIEGPGSVKI